MKFSEAEIKAIADYKQLDSSKDLNISNTFRTTGRETNAPWSNRFRKDFNDLAYDVKYTLIKGKDQMKRPQKYQNRLRNSKRLIDERFSTGRISSSSIDKSQSRAEMIKMNKKINPQKYDILESTRYSSINTQGLCKFQFEKTISGKLMHRSSKHLKFEHQTQRTINQNPIWYNKNNQIDFSKMFKTSAMRRNKSHDFSSYTTRRVFQPREQLDKFYNTDKCLRLTSAKRTKQTTPLNQLTGRKQIRPSSSSHSLSYNQWQAKKKIMRKISSPQINTLKRQLVFSKQVISPQRGCFR